jgi:hypothetical protein
MSRGHESFGVWVRPLCFQCPRRLSVSALKRVPIPQCSPLPTCAFGASYVFGSCSSRCSQLPWVFWFFGAHRILRSLLWQLQYLNPWLNFLFSLSFFDFSYFFLPFVRTSTWCQSSRKCLKCVLGTLTCNISRTSCRIVLQFCVWLYLGPSYRLIYDFAGSDNFKYEYVFSGPSHLVVKASVKRDRLFKKW